MERKTKPTMSKLRLPFFKRWKGRKNGSNALMDVSADAFILFDKNLDIKGMNPLARSLFHLILGENVIREDILNGAPNVKPDNKNNGRCEKYLNAIRKGKLFFVDSIVIHSGFLDIHLKVEAFKVGKGFGIIFSDLDALKKAEKTPYDSQEGLAINLQSVPDCIFIFDLKGTILHGSRAGERLTGYAWEEIKGKSFFEVPLFAPEYSPKAARLLELSAAGEPTGPDEFELIRKDGGHVFADISTCPIGGGEEREIVGIAHDITERKKSEEALRKSEERFRCVLENNVDVVFQVNLKTGTYNYISPSLKKMSGFSPEEMLALGYEETIVSLVHPDDRATVEEDYRKLREHRVEKGAIPILEGRIRHKELGYRWISITRTIDFDDKNIPIAMNGIIRDITKSKRAEEALQESEVRFRELFENMSSGVAVYEAVNNGEDFIFKDFNRAGEKIEKIGKKDVIGKRVTEAFPGVEEFGLFEVFQRVWRTGKPEYFPEAIYKDERDPGTWRESWVYKLPTGEIVAVYNDITERKRAEEKIKYQANLVENVSDAIISTDLNFNIISWNKAAETLYGWRADEVIGKPMAHFVKIEYPYAQREQVLEQFQAAGHWEGEVIQRRKDGTPINILASVTMVKDGRGNPVGAVAINRDITERKRAEEEIQSLAKFPSENPYPVLRVAKDGKVLYSNKAALELLAEWKIKIGEKVPGRWCRLIVGFFESGKPRSEEEEVEDKIFSLDIGLVKESGYVNLYGHDITERKKAEGALRESEERFRNVLDNALDMVYRLNLQTGTYDYVSPSTEKILGYSQEEFVAFTIEEGRSLAHPDDLARLDENVIELVTSKEGISSGIEYRIKHKELGYRWVSDSRSVVYDDGNNPVAVVGSLRDITERKRAEEALRQSEEKLRIMFEAIVEGVTVTDLQSNMVQVNEAVLRLHGYSRKEEILGRNAFELISPKDHVRAQDNMRKTLEEGQIQATEYTFLTKDGKEFEAELTAAVLEDKSGNATGLIALTKDITERKQAEGALQESERKFRSVLDHSVDVIYQVNLKTGTYDYVSPSSNRASGYTPEELIGFGFEKSVSLVHPDDRVKTREHFDKLVAGAVKEDELAAIEYRVNHKTLGYRWMSDTSLVLHDESGAPMAIIGNMHDITGRKIAEEALRDSEQKFKAIFDNATDGILLVDSESRQIYTGNKMMCQMLGVSLGELETLGIEDIHPGERLPHVIEQFEQQARGKSMVSQDIPVKRKDGGVFYADINSSRITLAGKSYLMGIFRDITERKLAEEALGESEEKYRALVNTAGLAGEGIMIVERAEGDKVVIAFVNDTLAGMLGYQREEMPGMPARDLFLPGDRIWLQEKNRKRRKGEALPSHYGVMALRKDGSMLPIEISMGAMRYQDKNATVVYVRDVTERKKAEESLRESEAQFRAIFDGAAIGVGLLDSDGRPFKINPALQQMLGYTLDELRSKAFSEYMHPDDAKVDLGLFREMVGGKRDHYQVEKRFIRKDGQTVWGRVTLSAVRGLGGKLQFVIGMIEDITDRKLALENLKKSEKYFRSLTENALEAIVVISADGTIKSAIPLVNPPRGYQPEEVIGTNSFSEVHPEDISEAMNAYNELMQNPGISKRTEMRVRHKDGSWRNVEVIARNLLDDPIVEGIVANYRDVTEREQAHEALLRHTRQVEALHAIAQLASQTLELEELLNTALEKLVEVMDADAGCVYLLDTVEKELVLRTYRGISDDMISRVATIKLNENNVQKILEWKGGSIPLRKIFEETGLSITKEAKEKEQIQSFAVAPFAVRGQLSGLIAVGNRADRKFSPGEIDLLRAVGNQIGIGTQNAMLYEEVRALIRETIDAQETERERICLEVHDGVAQTLVAAFQYLQALEATLPDDTKGSPLLAKATAQVKQAIQESREIINSLQPATLSDLGLVSTLRHELKRLAQETGLKIDFKADAIRLSKDIETGLYRIIHEAIANARKHADTKQLRVKISSEDGGVRVEVRDWGKGFDQVHLDRARRRGTGLFSIRKRAELLKGTCEIQSKPGEGTTVHVEVPFSAAEISSG